MRRLLLLNQVSGPLFRELAEDLSLVFDDCSLMSGHLSDLDRKPDESLRLISGPDYDRRNLWFRGWSWISFFLCAFRESFRAQPDTLLLIVSNPPFLGAIGWIFSLLRGQKYCVLIYDSYPGVLVQLKRISNDGFIAFFWHLFNRLVWSRAEIIFTIGDYMASNLVREGAPESSICVVPVWSDVEYIRPLPKDQNDFLINLGWADRFIVLYSGNIGESHSLNSLLEVSYRLRHQNDIGFLVIGSGSKWSDVSAFIDKYQLHNVKLLPFQPENMLPQTLPSGDISIVSMDPAIAGYMIPSKTYYYLAAGSALVAIVPQKNEVADLVSRFNCGICVSPDDVASLENVILDLSKM